MNTIFISHHKLGVNFFFSILMFASAGIGSTHAQTFTDQTSLDLEKPMAL